MTHSIIKAFGTCYKKCSPRNDGSRVDQGRSVDSCGSSCVPILSRPVRLCTIQHGPSELGLSKDPEINGLGRSYGCTTSNHRNPVASRCFSGCQSAAHSACRSAFNTAPNPSMALWAILPRNEKLILDSNYP